MLVVADMIGTGVFTTTGFLARDLQSGTAVLAAWLVGGFIAFCGALSYAELISAIPVNGGEYRLLSRLFHPALGFLAGFISLFVGFSAPIAASALAFGKYSSTVMPSVPPLLSALLLIGLFTFLHAFHVILGGTFQNIFTALKLLLIIGLATAGLVGGDPGRVLASDSPSFLTTAFSPIFAVGLIFVYFSYSGWNAAAYIAGEVKRPSLYLPVALLAGTGTVTLLYVLLNWSFLASAPLQDLSGKIEVGHIAATRLFGPGAGKLVSTLIALALVSSVSAMMMAGPRVYQAMGEDFSRLSFLRLRTRHHAPIVAVLLQGSVAALFAITATFEVLLTYIGFTLSLCAGLTALGVIRLRTRHREINRPYSVWLYPVPPILFAGLSSWIALYSLVEQPMAGVAGIVTIGIGLASYFLLGRTHAPKTHAPHPR
ncbi:MAG: amino acid permease [Deltaproteobacteria bacterium]|nr:amino acid permease [Deltaproteobacteria bacterium]